MNRLLCLILLNLFTISSCIKTGNKTKNITNSTNNIELMNQNMSKFSYSLALQAAEWGLPIVIMYNLRYQMALRPGAPSRPNDLWRFDNIVTPELAEKAGYVTPNVNVIYGFGFLDLSQEPIIISAPNSQNRYYMIQLVDMYTNSFAYIGGVETGYKGGLYAIVGPNWKGKLPKGVKRINAPTPWILIQPRVHVKNENDLPEAQNVLNDIIIKGLSEYKNWGSPSAFYTHYIPPIFNNPNLPVSAIDFKDPLQFWEILSAAINENPPPKDQITALLPMFKLLGVEFGSQWKEQSCTSSVVLESMKRAANEIGNLNTHLPVGSLANQWFIPPANIGNFDTDYYLRAIIARIGLTANIPKEALYFMANTDNHSQNLSSGKQYRITFQELPPYNEPGFWSLTAYRVDNNYTMKNTLHRYALGSDDTMQIEPDGSLTIYVQNTSPGKDKEANWLPTAEGDVPMYLILRVYAPGQVLIDSLSDHKKYKFPMIVINSANN